MGFEEDPVDAFTENSAPLAPTTAPANPPAVRIRKVRLFMVYFTLIVV
jgi:hypothetical protein